MKYLLLVCWDTDRMDAQEEPAEPPADEGFWWVDELRERGKWLIGDQLAPPRRAQTIRVRAARRSSPTARSPRRRRRSAGST